MTMLERAGRRLSAFLCALLAISLVTQPAAAQINSNSTGLPEATSLGYGDWLQIRQGGSTKALYVNTIRNGPSYLGAVATRIRFPTSRNTTASTLSANSQHIARDNITSLQVGYCNFYSDNTTHEAGSGFTGTWASKVQYPVGTGPWVTVTWGGSATSPVVPDGGVTPLSDPVPITIPDGSAFLVHSYQALTGNGIVFVYNGANDMRAANDAVQIGTSLADSTTIASPIAGSIYTPCRIVGLTRRASVAIIGDSRDWGTGHTSDGSGDVGNAAPTIGQNFAYANLGVSGEQLQAFLTNNSRRLPLVLSDYSHVVSGFGVNDIRTGARTASQIATDITSFVNLMGGKPVFWETIYGGPSSTDGYTTLANQTVGAGETDRIALNRMLRSGQVPGLTGVFDVAAAVESAPDSGKWAIGNGGQSIATDALHANFVGYTLIKNSGAVKVSKITR